MKSKSLTEYLRPLNDKIFLLQEKRNKLSRKWREENPHKCDSHCFDFIADYH